MAVFEVEQQLVQLVGLNLKLRLNTEELLVNKFFLNRLLVNFLQKTAQHLTHLEYVVNSTHHLWYRNEALLLN